MKSPKNQSKIGQEASHRRKLISDLIYMIETARHEVNKLKAVVKRSAPVER